VNPPLYLPLSSHPFPFSPVLEKGIVGYSTRQTDKTTRGREINYCTVKQVINSHALGVSPFYQFSK
jgi:hypothetical protein